MDLGKKILGQNIFDQLMKMTFYGQFVAGEDHISIKPLIQKNRAFGVGTVLDYSVEDRSHGDKPEREVATKRSKLTAFSRPSYSSSSISAAGDGGIGEHHRDKNYEAGKQLSDSQKEMIGPCTYFHADEAKCDHHMETFMKCIKASGGSSVDGFSAIKMTALGRPQLLLRFSDVLVKWQRFFTFLVSQQDGMEALQEKLELTRLQLGKLEPLLQNITVEDENQLRRTLQRLDVLGKCAIEHGVRLMVDAEQTYFQPAISKLTLDLQRMYNTEEPVVFKPYQCYLKEAYKNVTMDIELSKREGWRFAAKLVRGAYMHQERQRAKEFQYEDPINPDYGSTSRMYHRCLNHVLDEIGLNRKANVMVASHNEDTIIHTRIRINELGLLPRENKVFFGQLLGMCDQISFPLGQAGFPIYKYVPYGPVNEVMPYLSRRAQENRGFMKGAQKEKELLWNELKRRLVSGELLYRPVY